MGFHVCEFCKKGSREKNLFSNRSSGDVTFVFENGNNWVMPDMITHYVVDHGWAPPQEFINDVMNSKLVGGGRMLTRGLKKRVGYLKGSLEKGVVPEGFITRLKTLLGEADGMGNRVQTKGST